MKILQSSIFRAISAIAVGILLIKYPDNTVTWITVAIGVLFLLSGIISLLVYWHSLKQVNRLQSPDTEGVYVTDAEGRVVTGERPTFPIVGVGSAILGLMLALTPNIFISALMYIIGAVLILGAVNQFMNLLDARRLGSVGLGFWIFPSVILLVGLYVIVKPLQPASIAMLVLGWATLLYGVSEVINSIKIHRERRKAAKQQELQNEVPMIEEVKEEDADSEKALSE